MRPVGRSSMADDEISVIAFFRRRGTAIRPFVADTKKPGDLGGSHRATLSGHWGNAGPAQGVEAGSGDREYHPLRRLDAAHETKFNRSEEHTSELQSLMRISYAVFCLKKKNTNTPNKATEHTYKHQTIRHHTNEV